MPYPGGSVVGTNLIRRRGLIPILLIAIGAIAVASVAIACGEPRDDGRTAVADSDCTDPSLPTRVAEDAVAVLRDATAMAAATVPQGNPDAGRSDAERYADATAAISTSATQIADITRDFLASGRRVSSLTRSSALVSYFGPAPTIDEASGRATSVIRGIVSEQRFEADPRDGGQVISVICVTDWIKGKRVESPVTLTQDASISLNRGEFVLVILDIDPLVNLGADVIVFMEPASDDNVQSIEFTGVEVAGDGTVRANSINQHFMEYEGRAVSEFIAALQ